MRRWPIWVVAMLAGAGVLAAGSLGDGHPVLCGQRVCLRDRLPAPVALVTAHTTVVIARDGQARRGAAPRALAPPGVALFPSTDSWYVFVRGHLVIGRGRLTLWRSPAAGWSARHIGVVMVGGHRFAFQYAHRLYVGPFRGQVRAVARDEMPLGWHGDRLYTNSYPRRALLLRGPGRLLKMLSPLPFHSDPVVVDGSVYLLLGGELVRATGTRVRRLASLTTLGISRDSWLQPIGELLSFQDNRRLLILRADGSVFASTPLPRRDGTIGSLSASPVADPHRTAVAFTAAYGETSDPNAAARGRGEETVYLLRAGARRAVALHTEDVSFRVCERGASVQWHEGWLLYANSEGNLVLVDATHRPRAIDLTAVAAHLAGSGFDAHWS